MDFTLLRGSYVYIDLHIVRHYQAFPAHAKIAAFDLEITFKVRCITRFGVGERYFNAFGHVFDRNIECAGIAVANFVFESGGFHGYDRILGHVEITIALQMVVACAIIGIDGIGFNGGLNDAARQVCRVEFNISFKTGKKAVDRDAQIFDVKSNGRFSNGLGLDLGV